MKKRAFTLTELLVVVVIIGVLAAVALPKFTGVLEARRSTEAEDIMRAVRSEQEARCALDKTYTTSSTQLASFPKQTGNNFNYNLENGTITAARTGQGYTLQMLTYTDGRICCTGDGCNKVSKYPLCSTLTARANPAECVQNGAPVVPDDPVVDPPSACTNGTIQNHVACTSYEECVNEVWTPRNGWTADEIENCECDTTNRPATQECPNGASGQETASYECNTSTGRYEVTWDDSACTDSCNLSYTELDSYSEDDTCDGDNAAQYTGVPPNNNSCYDVYTEDSEPGEADQCPSSCTRTCPSGTTCVCTHHSLAGNPAGYYTQDCLGNNSFADGTTGVGNSGTQATYSMLKYRIVQCQ